ncbi:NmrA family NAD(P)-binding protein [Sphingomonas sp. Leaf23]|uniref:NmrA family NAD(P)-binding protein n=1 Tax=Sphingomonas sp. Leaf23 TaxID=1735689 RepID=UPI000A747343|nr:NmrA family NAD(P)-binding protein [Sphingomonas sp. Leaf23]
MVVERVLVTGSTGTTGRLLANLLRGRGAEVAAATRRVEQAGQVRFDWSDPASFTPALDGVDAAYVVAPTDRVGQLPVMRPFFELAAERLPGAIVLLSAASLPPGGPMMGAAHAWLRDHAPRWAVLRPSWFMQNFTGQYLPSIIGEGRLYSATGDGRVPFIDAADIAAVAAAALLTPEALSGELVLTGPEALTYDQAASAIAKAIGRPVQHYRLSVEALAQRYRSFGLPADYADLLAGMDGAIAKGSEDRITTTVDDVTGRSPTSLGAFLAENRKSFISKTS